jgi:hypothetical protein
MAVQHNIAFGRYMKKGDIEALHCSVNPSHKHLYSLSLKKI